MSAVPLSPKKYIETKARELPIFNCLVNKDWKDSQMANVVVMRQHTNGKITLGIYLVDLLCLGVKDSFYLFSVELKEASEKFSEAIFEEISYELAHNIIYAGHDFALEFEIEPCKEFATTKFLLEEDTDAIPLVEVAVGDADGKPHLMVEHEGDYLVALNKLKKNAGAGNYHYTVADDENEEEEDDDEGGDGEYPENIDEFEEDQINPYTVQFIGDDIANLAKIEERSFDEQLTLNIEVALRILMDDRDDLPDREDIYESDEFLVLREVTGIASGVTETQVFENLQLTRQTEDLQQDQDGIHFYQYQLDKAPENPLVVIRIFESTFVLLLNEEDEKGLFYQSKTLLDNLAKTYPVARLNLVLVNLLSPERTEDYDFIYNSASIENAFPHIKDFGYLDYMVYYLLQTVLHTERGDLKSAIFSYHIMAETDSYHLLLPEVQIRLLKAIQTAIAEE